MIICHKYKKLDYRDRYSFCCFGSQLSEKYGFELAQSPSDDSRVCLRTAWLMFPLECKILYNWPVAGWTEGEVVKRNVDRRSDTVHFLFPEASHLPGYSWRRKRHEGDKGGVYRIYFAFDYTRLSDFCFVHIVTSLPPLPSIKS